MENKLRCAVIGAGNMGQHHIRILSELKEEVSLVAVCEKVEEKGKELAKKCGATYYKNHLEMIEKEALDMVSICVPTQLHYRIGKDCLLSKLHILLEKPIAHKCEKAEELLELAKTKNVALLVGHTERFNPAVRKSKKLIESGAIGKVTELTARRLGGLPSRLKGNDIVFDLAIHDIDIINLLLSEQPTDLSIKRRKIKLEDQDDSVVITLDYKNAKARIEASWASPKKIRNLKVVGTKGSLKLDYIEQKIDLCNERTGDTTIEIAKRQPLKEELKYLVAAIREKEEIDSQFALDALRVALRDKRKELVYENI